MNLQQFLEEEIELFEKRYKNISTPIKSYGEYCDVRDFVRTSNTRLINKVLSEVQSKILVRGRLKTSTEILEIIESLKHD